MKRLKKLFENKNIAFGFAIGSAVILILLLKVADLGFETYHNAYVLKTLKSKFKTFQPVSKLMESQEIAPVLNSGDKETDDVITLLQLIEANKYQQAYNYLDNSKNIGDEFKKSFIDAMKIADTKFESLNKLDRDLDTLIIEGNNLKSRYTNIQKDVLNLLLMKNEILERKSSEEEQDSAKKKKKKNDEEKIAEQLLKVENIFYQGGKLEGCPIIPGFPEGISNMVGLNIVRKHLGAEEDIAEDENFDRYLRRFQESSIELKNEIENIYNKQMDNQNQRKEARKENREIQKKVISKLHAKLLSKTQEKISDTGKTIYNLAKTILEATGSELPNIE